MQLIPYLIFPAGNCEEALAFYGKALSGQPGHISRYADAPENAMGMAPDKIMHTHFAVDGNVLFMASDGPSNASDSGNVSLSLNFTDSGSIQAAFTALSEGGTVTMPLQDTFWGASFGMLKDKYGMKWMVNYDKPKTMMRKLFWPFALLLPFLSSAQSSKEEMEVMMKMLSLKTALLKKDSATLSSLLAGDVTYGHTNGLMQTKAQLIRSVVSGEQDYKAIEPSDMKIRTYGGTAVVNMQAKVNMLYNGSPLNFAMWATLVWIKQKDWILVARQSVKL